MCVRLIRGVVVVVLLAPAAARGQGFDAASLPLDGVDDLEVYDKVAADPAKAAVVRAGVIRRRYNIKLSADVADNDGTDNDRIGSTLDMMGKIDVTHTQNLITLVPEVAIRGDNLSDAMTTKRLKIDGLIAVVFTPQASLGNRLSVSATVGGGYDIGDGDSVRSLILNSRIGAKLCPGLCRADTKDAGELRVTGSLRDPSTGPTPYKLDFAYVWQREYARIVLPGRVNRQAAKLYSIAPVATLKDTSSTWTKLLGADFFFDATLRWRASLQLRYGIGAEANTVALAVDWHPLP